MSHRAEPRHSTPDQVRRHRPAPHPALRSSRRTIFIVTGVCFGAAAIALAASLTLAARNASWGRNSSTCVMSDFTNDYVTTYDNTQERWEVGGATIGSIPSGCYSTTLTVALKDSGGSTLTSVSGSPGASAAVFTFPDDANRPVPSSVGRVRVTIS